MPAAIGYAEESRIPFELGLIRNHYVGRTFIEPQQAIRHFGVQAEAQPGPRGPRGQARRGGRRLDRARDDLAQDREDGPRRGRARGAPAHLVAADDGPCYYGIDTPTRGELIASNHSVDEIRKFIDADSLGYLSLEGMLDAFGRPQQATCTACFTGIYPVEIEEEEREKEHALDAK